MMVCELCAWYFFEYIILCLLPVPERLFLFCCKIGACGCGERGDGESEAEQQMDSI